MAYLEKSSNDSAKVNTAEFLTSPNAAGARFLTPKAIEHLNSSGGDFVGVTAISGRFPVDSANIYVSKNNKIGYSVKGDDGTIYQNFDGKIGEVKGGKGNELGMFRSVAIEFSEDLQSFCAINPTCLKVYVRFNKETKRHEFSTNAPNNDQITFSDSSVIHLPDAKQMTKLLLSGVTNGVELKTKWATLGDVQKVAILGENGLLTTATVEQLGAILAV